MNIIPTKKENEAIQRLTDYFGNKDTIIEKLGISSSEELKSFLADVDILLTQYQKQESAFTEYIKDLIFQNDSHIEKIKAGIIGKADSFALSINDKFQEIKRQILESEKRYTDAEMARQLTKQKVSPPRGNPGDDWSINAVQRHEKRIKKLTNG